MRKVKSKMIRALVWNRIKDDRVFQLDNGMVVCYASSVYRSAKRLLKGKTGSYIKKVLN